MALYKPTIGPTLVSNKPTNRCERKRRAKALKQGILFKS